MSDTEKAVARHYSTGKLTQRVQQALGEMGVDPNAVTADDLKAGDEFHTGGVAATDHLFGQLTVSQATRMLDIGSGIGGTARYVADRYGAQVVGVDLTPEFVETATALSALVGLDDKVQFKQGSAIDLPVEDAGFDLAVMLHVGMNIADKAALFAQVARVLKPGGAFALFDVMRGGDDGPLSFPLPWSTEAGTSFVDSPGRYRDAAEAVGLTLRVETDRTEFAKEFFAEVFAKIASDGPSPLGIHLMMGETAPEKFANYVADLQAGRIRPTEMIFEKTG